MTPFELWNSILQHVCFVAYQFSRHDTLFEQGIKAHFIVFYVFVQCCKTLICHWYLALATNRKDAEFLVKV